MRASRFHTLTLVIMLVTLQVWGAETVQAQTQEISFTTTEGTWISLDVNADGRTIAFELLGPRYKS